MAVDQKRIASNLEEVRGRMAAAAQACGRSGDDITLVAVTKYVSIDEAKALVDAGCEDLGESRPQQLWEKTSASWSGQVRWHMIGHLQRNKVARTLPLVEKIHSGDSLRLLRAIDEAALKASLSGIPVLLEINVSGDSNKHGFPPREVVTLAEQLLQFKQLKISGLMAMASRTDDESIIRANFSDLRELRDELQTEVGDSLNLSELSMGMSSDYEIAIAEGATIVRVGSALFK